MKDINLGTFPTMITPYHDDNTVDYEAVKNITKWYIDEGCTGIFAVCQSSEMIYLSLEEKVKIAETVVNTVKESGKNVSVVASGHTSDDMNAQIAEMTAMAQTGVDAIVWVSNRLDLHNDGDDVWIKNAEYLLSKLPEDIAIGIYECPYPYKRLLTPKILDWCISTGRFTFIKDTCCDPDMLYADLNSSRAQALSSTMQTLRHFSIRFKTAERDFRELWLTSTPTSMLGFARITTRSPKRHSKFRISSALPHLRRFLLIRRPLNII